MGEGAWTADWHLLRYRMAMVSKARHARYGQRPRPPCGFISAQRSPNKIGMGLVFVARLQGVALGPPSAAVLTYLPLSAVLDVLIVNTL